MDKILLVPDPILRQKAKNIKKVTSKDIDFSKKMIDIMLKAPGVGLAANQVGIDMNMFIIDIAHTDENEFPRIFINGKIIKLEGESTFSEGCLSIPQVALEVIRPESILFKYQDINEKWHEEKFDGLLSRAIQHEIDHLNGVLIIDLVDEIQKAKVQKEVNKIKNDSISRIKQNSSDKRFVL